MSKRAVVFIAIIIFSIFNVSYALQLEIIYPRPESNLPSVDSTFIFGNTKPGSRVLINGRLIPVHEEGGFLGFVDVNDGEFTFEVTAISGADTAIIEIPVIIGTAKVGVPPDSLYIHPGSELPAYEMSVPGDELIEIGFKGTAGCKAYYSTALDTTWRKLNDGFYESGESGSVFGNISAGEGTSLVNYRRYVSALDLVDTTLSYIQYKLVAPGGDELVVASREKIALLDSEMRVVEFTGQAQIVRSARQAGYVLLYQPPGVRAVYDGYEGDYARIKLSENLTGFVPADSVVILPEGIRKPSSRIRYLRAEDHPQYTELRIPLREPLPYQIRQELNPSRMNIFIYGGIGDTDWIKYVPVDGAIELIRWYQQSDGVYALSLELKDDLQWGYSHGYDGNTFTLRIKKRPAYGGFLQSEVKGLRVVIDPGHCPDTGAVGPTGLLEKDINLWISHKLRKILEKNGAEVIQTRYGHEPVDIYERPQIAERFNADILISVHNNALPDGVNPFENNGVSSYYYHTQSKPLADAIQRRLIEKTGLPDFGVYYGNLALTRPTEFISVLVECAFMMIPEQEALLKDWDFQEKCAEAIYLGICDFLRDAEK